MTKNQISNFIVYFFLFLIKIYNGILKNVILIAEVHFFKMNFCSVYQK